MSIEKDIAVPSELRVSARRGLKTLWSPRVYIQPRGTVLRPPAPSKVRQAPVFPKAVCFPFVGNIAAVLLPFHLLATLSYFCLVELCFLCFFSLLLTSRYNVSSLISLLLLALLSFHLSFRFFLISSPVLLPFRLLCSFPCLFFRVFFSVYTSCHFFCFISVPVF